MNSDTKMSLFVPWVNTMIWESFFRKEVTLILWTFRKCVVSQIIHSSPMKGIFSNPPTLENTSPLRYLPLRPLPPSGISNAFCGGILTYSGTTQCFITFWGLKGKL